MVPHELDSAVVVFDQRRAAFDPIAAVVVGQLAQRLDGRRVDVAADDAVAVALAGVHGHHFLEAVDVVDGPLDVLLHDTGCTTCI